MKKILLTTLLLILSCNTLIADEKKYDFNTKEASIKIEKPNWIKN